MSKITTEALRELALLKKTDKESFLKQVEEMAIGSVDILLTYKKFKEYPANI